MSDNLIKALSEIANTFSTIPLSQIPDIDLYVDQITTFAEDKLKSYKRNDNDKLLTKTMINNYTKAGLIKPPIKKKYTKSNLITLILIYHLKSIMSISDIKSLLDSIDENQLENIYNKFTQIQESEKNNISEKLVSISADNENTMLITALLLIVQANLNRVLAEKIIDNYFNNKEDSQ